MELCVGERLGKTRTNRKTSHRQRPARVNGRADRLHAERTLQNAMMLFVGWLDFVKRFIFKISTILDQSNLSN